jgi:hypothetical protein
LKNVKGVSIVIFVFTLLFSNVCVADESTKEQKLVELMKLNGLYELLENQMDVGKKQAEDVGAKMMEEFRANLPGLGGSYWDQMNSAYQKFIQTCASPAWTIDEAVKKYADLYGQNITEDELDQILVFYKSPIGQKDILASQRAVPLWTEYLGSKNMDLLQENYKTFVQELKMLAVEYKKSKQNKE